MALKCCGYLKSIANLQRSHLAPRQSLANFCQFEAWPDGNKGARPSAEGSKWPSLSARRLMLPHRSVAQRTFRLPVDVIKMRIFRDVQLYWASSLGLIAPQDSGSVQVFWANTTDGSTYVEQHYHQDRPQFQVEGQFSRLGGMRTSCLQGCRVFVAQRVSHRVSAPVKHEQCLSAWKPVKLVLRLSVWAASPRQRDSTCELKPCQVKNVFLPRRFAFPSSTSFCEYLHTARTANAAASKRPKFLIACVCNTPRRASSFRSIMDLKSPSTVSAFVTKISWCPD
ncbi:hypothetical protein IWZ01DRAFT_278732 [Phyllosticta capitalensis]